MAITPDSVIKILKNVPLDMGYQNTIWFDNSNAQSSYFESKAVKTMDASYYMRVDNGAIRVDCNADVIRDCNYMMFKNTHYLNKWFYAFIKQVRYVNDNCCEVEFVIDDMQTYLFNHDLLTSFVVREHSETDVVGENILPETVDIGEYVNGETDRSNLMNKYCVVILVSALPPVPPSTEWLSVEPRMVGGVFTGLYAWRFDIDTQLSSAISILKQYSESGHASEVVSIFMFPTNLASTSAEATAEGVVAVNKYQSTLGNYRPRNKKLLTAPYNFMKVTNINGGTATYPYEFFDTEENFVNFVILASVYNSQELLLVPVDYKGLARDYNASLSIEFNNQCGYNVDTFKAWLAQNKYNFDYNYTERTVNTVRDIVGMTSNTIKDVASGNVGGLLADVHDFTNYGINYALGSYRAYCDYMTMAIAPDHPAGSQTAGVGIANKVQDFYFTHCYVREAQAKIIDDYFDMFGYTTNKVKVPNRNARPCWTYTQTQGCNIRGEVPSDSLARLRAIYDKGITFWKIGTLSNPNDDSKVGMYKEYNQTLGWVARDNKPLI